MSKLGTWIFEPGHPWRERGAWAIMACVVYALARLHLLVYCS